MMKTEEILYKITAYTLYGARNALYRRRVNLASRDISNRPKEFDDYDTVTEDTKNSALAFVPLIPKIFPLAEIYLSNDGYNNTYIEFDWCIFWSKDSHAMLTYCISGDKLVSNLHAGIYQYSGTDEWKDKRSLSPNAQICADKFIHVFNKNQFDEKSS